MLSRAYSENHISLRLAKEGRIHFDTNLVSDGHSAKDIKAEII